MSETQSADTGAGIGGDLERFRRKALHALDEALSQPASAATAEVDVAERAVVQLRDVLIEHIRAGPGEPDASRMRNILDQVNAAISLIVAVEYPVRGLQRQVLQQARDAIARLSAPGATG